MVWTSIGGRVFGSYTLSRWLTILAVEMKEPLCGF